MFRSLRFNAVLLSSAIVFAAGCEKSSTTGSGGGGSGGTPPRAGKTDDGAGKKLVGTWEGTDESMPDKDGKPVTVTFEFKADGKMAINMGPFDLTGTYKVTKEDGKTLTVDTEMSLPDLGGKGAGNSDKKVFTITFENDNTIVMTPTDKKDPKTFKRKA